MDATCETCGQGFQAQRSTARYCHECRVKQQRAANRAGYAKRPKPTAALARRLTCQVCRQGFDSARSDAKYCPVCRLEVQRAQRRANDVRKPNNCLVCGTPIGVTATHCAHHRRPQAKTQQCKECGTSYIAKKAGYCPACIASKRRAANYDANRPKATCPDCGGPCTRGRKRCKSCYGKAQIGKLNGNWKGGIRHNRGYIEVRTNPRGTGGNAYRPQHHIVWEAANNKPLPKGWVVHHFNGIKDDNRPENLLGLPRHEHHRHPREALRPYEKRILALEAELKALQQLKMVL